MEKNKSSTIATWKKLLPFIKPYVKLLILLAFLMILAACIDVIIPLLNGIAVSSFIEPKTTEGIWQFFAACLLLISLQVVGTIFLAMLALRVEMYISRDLKKTIFKHLQTLSFDYYNSTPVGTTLARLMSDTNRIGGVVAWGIVDIVWCSASIIGYIIMMCIINIQLALLIILIVPFISVITYVFQKKILKANRDVRRVNAELTRNYNEGISGAKTSKTMVIEEKNLNSFKNVTGEMKRTSVRAVLLSAVYIPIVAGLTSLCVAMILNTGGTMVIDGFSNLTQLTIFINYALVISDPVQQLARTISNFIATQVNIERCNYILELKPLVSDTPAVIEKYGDCFNPKKENWESIDGHIEFKDVTFMYHDGTENVLENFNLDIPCGTTVAIVGETGAGKSTLVNLVCRFFEPTDGKILIDGKDYKERSLLWLHSNIGYVLQSPHLFSGSIKENIRYGKLDATDEEIIAAAKIVSAHESILLMEKGYDTEVGEGGDRLSTGQKQLISFARAIISNPRIFVLDEATSSIDTETEENIQNAIGTLLGNRTSFLIAHRLSTIRKANIILVVRNGKIMEQGTHKELLSKNGYYSDLYNKQFEDENSSKVFSET